MSNKRVDNVEFVNELMNYSKFGAMSQLVILQAIEKYASAVMEVPLDEFREAMGENSIISADAWHGACCEIIDKMKKRYPLPS